MKRRITFCFVLIFYSILSAQSQNKVGVKPLPEWVDKVSYDYSKPDAYQDSVSEGYYYPVQDLQIHVGKKTYFFHYVRRIISERGVQNNSEIKIDFDPSYEKLSFHEVKIIRNNKEINKLDLKKIKVLQRETERESHVYNGLLSALLIMEDIRPNDIIEYSFSIEGMNPIYKDKYFDSFYLQLYDPTAKIYRSIIIPKERSLFFKTHLSTIKPLIKSGPTETKYIWDLTNVAGLHPEEDEPGWYNPYPSVWVSEYNSWQQVIEWALKLYSISSYTIDKGLRNKIEQLKKNHSTKEEQLVATLRFVQDSIRYTGIEDGVWSVKPFSPNQVFNLRYGDCKGKALLLCWMLNALEIKAYPALVNSSYRQELNNLLPSPTIFDHCIVNVELNGNQHWYDATQSLQKGKHDKIFVSSYKAALVLKPGNTGLSKMEVTNISRTKIVEHYFIDTINKGARLEVETEYEGYDADLNRGYFQNSAMKEVEKNYLNYYLKNFPFIHTESLPTFRDDENENILTTQESYFIDSLWISPDTTVPSYIESSFYAQSLYEKIRKVSNLKRKSPFAIEHPLEYEYVIKLHLPEPWTVNEETTEIKAPGFVYTRKTTYKNNVITIKHLFKTTAEYIQGSEIAEYNKQISKVENLLGYSLQYNDGKQSTSGSNWSVILIIVVSAVVSFGICWKLYNYDPAPIENVVEEKIGGWLIVFAIGAFLFPFLLLYEIYKDNYLYNYDWLLYLSKGSTFVDGTSLVFNTLTLAGNILLFSFSVLLLIVFIQRRSNTPLIVVVLYTYNILMLIINASFMNSLGLASLDASSSSSIRTILPVVVKGVIWILYFRISDRSKRTFVVRRHKQF